jgi:hypothetical protein
MKAPKIAKAYRTILKNIVVTLVLLCVLAFIMYQVTVSISTMIFVNRVSEEEVVALRYTNSNITFASSDLIDSISGRSVLSLNLSSQTQMYYLYSENFTSNEIKDVGILILNGKEFPVLWGSEVSDGKERIIYGKFVDFYKMGTRERVQVLVVEDFHEPGLLDQMVSTNKLMFFQIVIISAILTVAFALAALGVGLWLWATLEEMQKK